ncbi:MAG: hypothetical protein HQL59_07995 [Magnetococcales bacterium]|nr:hypothetical protein [Magnetococcales bacterium]
MRSLSSPQGLSRRRFSLGLAETLGEPGGGSMPPSERLFVLAAHREREPLIWLDRMGYRVGALWRRWWHRPVALLRLRSILILEAAEALYSAGEEFLREEMGRQVAVSRGAVDPGAPAILDASLKVAVVAVRRVTGLIPHEEQVMGALALLENYIAEMATGEGKTLTAALAVVTAAWRGWPCQVVTANDYLARRDAELFARLFAYCGLSVTHIDGETPMEGRQAAYRHDVVYTTAKELLGDYLRDKLALGKSPSRTGLALRELGGVPFAAATGGGGQVVMRGLQQVIVDEADSVLIDEAVTPLIISTPRPDGSMEAAARDAVALARSLEEKRHYRLNRALRHVELTNEGKRYLAGLTTTFSAFWQSPSRVAEVVEQALYAMHLMVRDQHYVIRDDKIVLVDELTGRLADQRTLSVGMQQVLEASEGVPISPPTEVSARLSFQRFFRLFPRMGGMTGTAAEARAELLGVYRLSTLSIPTHRPVARRILPIRFFPDEATKCRAIVEDALTIAGEGRAVLIGMRSVLSSETLFRHFTAMAPARAAGIPLLHAVNHRQESAIVARAGAVGAITIATNMAGRGTDIALDPVVRERGGLHVIIGEPNDFGRIDRQLLGRSARQGDPGSVRSYLSLEDEVVRRFLPALLLRSWRRLQTVWPRQAARLATPLLKLAQSRAEGFSFRQRQNILEQDTQLDRSGF